VGTLLNPTTGMIMYPASAEKLQWMAAAVILDAVLRIF